MLEVELHDDPGCFDRLAPEWRSLAAAAQAGVFLQPTWQRLWWEHLAGPAELRVFTFREGGHLVGLAPLMCLPSGEIQLVGGLDVADYLDLLYLPGRSCDVSAALLDTLARRTDWKALTFQDVREASMTRRCLPHHATERSLVITQAVEETCPRIALPASFDAYLESLPVHDRHELRRKMRRSANRRGFRFTAIERQSELVQAAAEFLDLHVKSSGDKATFMTEAMHRFFVALAAHGEELGVVLHFIEIGGRRVAGLFNYRVRDELWGYNSGSDPEYSQFSVGVAIFGFTLEWAIGQGMHVFDFLRGSEAYKYNFGPATTQVWRLHLTRDAKGGA